MIEPPVPSRSRPAPTVQRRSKPVKGSVDASAGCVLVAGVLSVVGATSFAGVVVVGVFVDFDGDVPLFGLVVGVGGFSP
jgi:hypothetical protein